MPYDNTPPMRRRCVGCQEAPGTLRVPELGYVCESCAEVVDIVFEVEIERVQEATRQAIAFAEECGA